MFILPASLLALALAFFMVKKKFKKFLANIAFMVFALVCGVYSAREYMRVQRTTILLSAADFQCLVGMNQESMDLLYYHS